MSSEDILPEHVGEGKERNTTVPEAEGVVDDLDDARGDRAMSERGATMGLPQRMLALPSLRLSGGSAIIHISRPPAGGRPARSAVAHGRRAPAQRAAAPQPPRGWWGGGVAVAHG